MQATSSTPQSSVGSAAYPPGVSPPIVSPHSSMGNAAYPPGMVPPTALSAPVPASTPTAHEYYVTHGNVIGLGDATYQHGAQVYDPSQPFSNQVNRFDAVQRFEIAQHWPEYNRFIGTLDSSMHAIGSNMQEFHDGLYGDNHVGGYPQSAIGTPAVPDGANTLGNTYSSGTTASPHGEEFQKDPQTNTINTIGLVGALAYKAYQTSQKADAVAKQASEGIESVGYEAEASGVSGAAQAGMSMAPVAGAIANVASGVFLAMESNEMFGDKTSLLLGQPISKDGAGRVQIGSNTTQYTVGKGNTSGALKGVDQFESWLKNWF